MLKKLKYPAQSTAYLKLQLWFKKNQQWLLICLPLLCIIGIAFSVTAQFLKLNVLPVTPADDLARHVAMVENFFIALKSGQFIPIIQKPPFADVPDMPVFQYYGFMTGLIALPGMLLSLSSLKALMIGVFVFRIAGAAGVYWTGKLLGGNRKVAILAALVYYMTPYVISNLYGRVAVPESLAHCELPFIVLGLLLGLRGYLAAGAATIAITVLLLSLTHPIFLLFGCIALILMMSVSLSRRVFVTGSVGLMAGILLSTFRWYPIYLTKDLLSRFESYISPEANKSLTSWQGLIEFPKSLAALTHSGRSSFAPVPPSDIDYLFLTPGWFTLPAILGLILLLANRSKITEKFIILIPNIIFLLLAFSVGDIYRFLPHIIWTVQFPYRLLSFVGLFTAFALPILLPRLKTFGFVAMVLIAVIQSAALIVHPTYREPLKVSPDTIARAYANYDYAISDKYAVNEGDNWMFDYAKRFYPNSPGQSLSLSPAIEPNNLIPKLLSPATQQYIHLQGVAISSNAVIDAWLEDPYNPLVKSKVQQISPGSFSVMFALPVPNSVYRLVTHPKLIVSNTDRGTVIQLRLAEGIPFHYLKHPYNDQIPAELRLAGKSAFNDQAIELWFAKPSDPLVPVTGKVRIPPGEFNVSLPYPSTSDDYILVPSRTRIPADEDTSSSEQRRLSLDLKYADVVPRNMPAQPRITYEWIDTKEVGGYSRLYSIRRAAWWTPDGRTNQPGTVELPIAYNPFYIFTQNDHLLISKPDEKARTNVITNDLVHDIVASYRLPLICYVAPIMGLVILVGFAGLLRGKTNEIPTD
ncbi:4-amino-4-deoxy-L-arabinose transferase-like glycosyltransferase [Methylobacter tundripaludum]|uniref:4-amino-4-deoxy-L-arabinose transferase-like glycosyltransferase n=2 Tax=Methylobacter tundripaludum TaxID=173365 RepID=A0A2S6H9H9_9GAMM|nr:4-amino-4-deoxy-L-arabinose transferase-like glycosyltransferase [Methylobacter tundripaludum]